MPNLLQHAETDLPTPDYLATFPRGCVRPPGWFRYGVIAAATLILCSCQAVVPAQKKVALEEEQKVEIETAVKALTRPSVAIQATFDAQIDNAKSKQNLRQPVVPAIYQQDKHAPPSGIRQAEYQAGIRPASCQLPGCGPCTSGGCSTPGPGPRDEYLCDGGDYGFAASVREDWQIDGLEQEDTVAHYDSVDGQTFVTPSNRVCIYAPRFGVVRRVVDLHEYARIEMPSGATDTMVLAKIDENETATTTLARLEPTIHRAEAPPSFLRERQRVGELDRDLHVGEFDGSLAPYANLQVIRIGTISNEEKAQVAQSRLAAFTWAGDQAVQISIDSRSAQAAVGQRQAGVVYHQEDPTKPSLRLIKLASTGAAKPGDEIEFTLRFDNLGSQVMGNVTIVDHLTTRLRYVPDSAKSSVEADFSAEPNAKGSIVLRWEITEPIEAGKGGILQFKCKVL